MAFKLHIKKDDVVVAIKGVDAASNKTGKVLRMFPSLGKALVEGFNKGTKHLRRSQEHPKGMVVTRERPMPAANLMLFCPHCKKGIRILRAKNEKGGKARKCRKCGHFFD